MDNRRVILAVILSVAVLVAWQLFFAPPPPPPPAPGEVPVTAEPTATAADEGRPGGAAEPGSEPPAAGAEPEAEIVPVAPTVEEEPVSGDREEVLVVDTDLYRAALSNRGGHLVAFELNDHQARSGGAVDLVRAREAAPYPFSIVDTAGSPLPLDDVLYAVERGGGDGDRTLTFRYSGPAGSAVKVFTFHDRGLFEVEVKVRRPAEPRWRLYLGPGIRNPSPDEEKSRFEKPAAVYSSGGQVAVLDARKAKGGAVVPGGGLDWIGLEDTYFLAAILPRNDTLGQVELLPLLQDAPPFAAESAAPAAPPPAGFRPLPANGELSDEDGELQREYALLLAPRFDNLELDAYWGAKKLSHLADIPGGLEATVNLGWFGFLARWILMGLNWIYDNMVQNYGWSIVLMTLLIKLLLLPLTHKSQVSMQKMQQINPQMQAIRAKWRGKLRDKQGKMNLEAQRQMNEEMQKLYREAGVNPVGGCLPMLLQMPVLFAFYQLLYSAVELRGEPWILWITDLTQPFWPLAVVMGGTQFLQMRLMPATGDPMQRRLMMMMPIVFTIFFLGFPSGLVLYWLTNNVLTIAQQGLYNRWKKQQEDKASMKADDTAETRKGGKGSRRVAAK